MTHRLQNTTIDNGFVSNPDKVYFVDYFDKLPNPVQYFTLPSTAGVLGLTVTQPANTFLKQVNVVCTTEAVLASGGNIGLVASKESNYATKYIDSATNISDSTQTIVVNSGSVMSPASPNRSFSNSSRTLYLKVTTSVNATTRGKFKMMVVFGSINNGLDMSNQTFSLLGVGVPLTSFVGGTTTKLCGMSLKTSTTENDKSIIFPNIDFSDAPISSGIFRAGTHLEMDASVVLPSLASTNNYGVLIGLRETRGATDSGDLLLSTDTTKAYFAYGKSLPLLGASKTLTSELNWQFVYSVDGSSYITDLGVPIVAKREYHLRIYFNGCRKISVFINGVQYGLTSTAQSGTSYGVTEKNTHYLSKDMKNEVLYPMVGIDTTNTTSSEIYINYIKLSRNVKESYDFS